MSSRRPHAPSTGPLLPHTVAPLALAGLAALALLAPPAASAAQPDTGERSEAPCSTGWDLGGARLSLGGQYRLMANGTNVAFHAPSVGADQEAESLANARYRTWFNVHDGERCRYGAYVQAEIGHVMLGDGGEFPKTFGSDADRVGVELRRGFLWYTPTDTSLIRAGVLAWEDRFGERPTFGDSLWAVDRYDTSRAPLANSVWDFDVSGIVYEATAGDDWHYSLGALVLDHGTRTVAGDGSAVLLTTDVDRAVGTSLWGASVYYLRDRAGFSHGDFGGFRTGDDVWELWVGGRGHLQTGRIDSSLFLIVNTGESRDAGWEHTGSSAKVASRVPFEVGALHVQTLYSTGDDDADPRSSGEFRTIAQSVRDNRGAQSYWSLLGLTSPRGPSDVNDLGIGLQNGGHGLITLQGAWEQPLASGLTTYLAAGWLRADTPGPASDATDIGTELLGELHWQMADMLTLDAGMSWLFTGDFFRTSPIAASPDDLYEVYARWQLEF